MLAMICLFICLFGFTAQQHKIVYFLYYLGFTALQHIIGYIAPVCVNESVSVAVLYVAQSMNFPISVALFNGSYHSVR